MKSNLPIHHELLQWLCQNLPRDRVYNMEFADGEMISILISKLFPCIILRK